MSTSVMGAAGALTALAALLLAACAPSRAPGSPATATGLTPPAAAAPARPDAQAVESFYRGKTLRFITGFSAGGLFDNYTRAAARYLGKHLPGAPNIVVENMTGAGGLLAPN